MRKKQSSRIALCGIICGLSVVVLSMGSILPLATFVAPALAGVLLLPVATECGKRLCLLCYAAVSLLAVLLVPDTEIAALYIAFLGYYPLLKALLEKLSHKLLRLVAKLACFNAAILGMYWVLLRLFPLPALVAEFSETGTLFLAGLLALGNLCFVLYDILLQRLHCLYWHKLRPRLF